MKIPPGTPNEVTNESRSPATATPRPRPLYWSVRRELWENRSIYIAPLAAAGVVLFGFSIAAPHLPGLRRNALLLETAQQQAAIEMPYEFAALVIMLAALIAGVFYCLDALHGERRDRSILFWKSLPVSDLTAVLAKLSIPLVILPLLTVVITTATQLFMLLLSTVALLPSGLAGTTWAQLPVFQLPVILLYNSITMAIWQAPIYGWLLLVSGWARRATFLWAVLPWLAVCLLEKIGFNTTYLTEMVGHRLTGSFDEAFAVVMQAHGASVSTAHGLARLAPIKFLFSPGLWIGLILATVFVAGAVRLRRDRGPL